MYVLLLKSKSLLDYLQNGENEQAVRIQAHTLSSPETRWGL